MARFALVAEIVNTLLTSSEETAYPNERSPTSLLGYLSNQIYLVPDSLLPWPTSMRKVNNTSARAHNQPLTAVQLRLRILRRCNGSR